MHEFKGRLSILGTRGIPARYGGFETFAQELSVRLAKRGIDVVVYCEAPASDSVSRMEKWNGVSLAHVPRRLAGGLGTLLFDIECLFHASQKEGVIYLLGYGAAIFGLIPRVRGVNLWINPDGIEWKRSKWSLVARTWLWLQELATAFVATTIVSDSYAITSYLAKKFPFASGRTVTISYGVNIVDEVPNSELARWKLSPNEFFLVVCRLEPENNVHLIIDGFLDSGSSKKLVIVGDVNHRNSYHRALLERNVANAIFVGGVYEAAMLGALRQHAAAYIHGHSVGGTNPSLLEALAAGSPIIAHRNQFNMEVMKDAGSYFGTARELAEAIQRVEGLSLAERKSLRDSEMLRARSYDWECVTDQYSVLLASVM